MYTIIFNTNPNSAPDIAHRDNFSKCTVQDQRIFENKVDAVRFWFECTSPITPLNYIIPLQSQELNDMYNKPITEFDITLVTDRVLNQAVENSDDYI